MDNNEMSMSIFNSAGYQHCKDKKYSNAGVNYWHPGFAWAITRKAYEKMGGLYELGILGSGDNIMMLSLLGNGPKGVNSKSSDDYLDSIIEFQDRVKQFRFGYTPGVIRHYYHGSKQNRRYRERWEILLKHEYSPKLHIEKDSIGILIPTKLFPIQLEYDIYEYFKERNEDEI